MKSLEQEKVGSFIISCRKEIGMKQSELAKKIGVGVMTVSNWEKGKSFPSVPLLKKICNELGITVDELLSGEKKERSAKEENNIDYNKIPLIEVESFFSSNDMMFFIKNGFSTLGEIFDEKFTTKLDSFTNYPLNERTKIKATIDILKCKYLRQELDLNYDTSYREFEHKLGISYKTVVKLHYELGINKLDDLLHMVDNNKMCILYKNDIGIGLVNKLIVIRNYLFSKKEDNLLQLIDNNSSLEDNNSLDEIYRLYGQLKQLVRINEEISIQIKLAQEKIDENIRKVKR